MTVNVMRSNEILGDFSIVFYHSVPTWSGLGR